MNDSFVVRGFKRLRHLPRDEERLLEGNRARVDSLGERPSFDELENEGRHSVRMLRPVNRGDVRMVERCENVGLPLESLLPQLVVGEEIGEDLDRDLALQLGVLGAVHLAHPAGSEGAEDPVRAQSGPRSERHDNAQYMAHTLGFALGIRGGRRLRLRRKDL
jgi:hypothetical protein